MQQSTPKPNLDVVAVIADELKLPATSVAAVAHLLGEGATVPFIARYRKEATGGLDEVQIRAIEERRAYLIELEERKATILTSIGEQGKLTPELAKRIVECRSKQDLEDLYLPFKPKRRTRATIARERGLEPLADRIWSQATDGDPRAEAAKFVDPAKEVADADAALAGARDICAERAAEHADARKLVRETFSNEALIAVEKKKEFEDKATKFDSWANYQEKISTIPSHRYLAIRRGEAEGVLRAILQVDGDRLLPSLERVLGLQPSSPWSGELRAAIEDAYKRLLAPSVETDVRVELKLRSDRAAVDVFARNLRELLLAAPFGTKTVLGIDPGQRTGCKCAVVDETGKVLAHETIYLVQGDEAAVRARGVVRELCRRFAVRAVAVGNGTHGRETETFVKEVLTAEGLREVLCVPVSESGASVYSASEVAREEFPDLDLTVRGAISIARRLQDPLAELVKVDPKSIGVGQYQHDVFQPMLARKLDEVIESCVNQVGVEVNTASAPLLARVSGIGNVLAKRIVSHRDQHGAFKSRKELMKVSGVGARTFEQAAGFLRVRGGEHPLDSSAVHPERYPLVERIAQDLGVETAALVGNEQLIGRIDGQKYQAGDVGTFTMADILAELRKPGRDPRDHFEPPAFRDDVRTMEDLKPGMDLEGVVTNVTAFGAFVDIGVHQDGLVHVSRLADRFVEDPNTVVKVGDKLRVRVLEVDLERKRISLSARKNDQPQAQGGGPRQGGKPGFPGGGSGGGKRNDDRGRPGPSNGGGGGRSSFSNNPFAKLLQKK